MFTVAIDFDGVLNNLPEVWREYLNNTYYKDEEESQVQELHSYNMCDNFPYLSYNAIMWPLVSAHFWEKVSYKDSGAAELLDKLSTKYTNINVIVVTATDPEHWTTKYKYCFERLFPRFPKSNIVLTSQKNLIKCDVLVDDNPEYLRDTSAYKILLSASYNKNRCVDVDEVCNTCTEVFNAIIRYHSHYNK